MCVDVSQVSHGRVVGVGRTRTASVGAAWMPMGRNRTDPVQFVTVGDQGLLLWTLTPSCLEQVRLV